MPKVRDLAISAMSVDRPAMYAQWGRECAEASAQPPECIPSIPPREKRDDASKEKCDHSRRPEKHERKEEKYVHGLPADAVIQLRQQLQHRVSHPHS